jgi:hypothetical protein
VVWRCTYIDQKNLGIAISSPSPTCPLDDWVSRYQSTAETYSSGLLLYHVFCDQENLPEEQRALASPVTISAFVSSLAGCYSGKTLSNYFYGVRAWHILHGVTWTVNNDEMDALLRAADNLTPASSKRKRCLPYTLTTLATVHSHLNLADHFDAAI